MIPAILIAGMVIVVFWMPIVIRFWRNWRRRRTATSLGICMLSVFATWMAMLPYWLLLSPVGPQEVGIGVLSVDAVVLAIFHLTIWRDRHFIGERKEDE